MAIARTGILAKIVGLSLLSVTTTAAQASFFDQMKDAYQDIEKTVEKNIKSLTHKDNAAIEPEATPVAEASKKTPPATLEKDIILPEHWQSELVVEPTFNDEIFVLQSGLQHSQTVLLVHGLGQNGYKDWLKVIPALEKNYHVLTLDLPGFGNSAAPSGRYSPTNYAQVLSWLVDTYAKGKAAVVGHSMGGAVALRFASGFPDKVSNLTLVDAAGILERTAFLKHMTRLPIRPEQAPKPLQKLGTQLVDLGNSVIELSALTPDPTRILNTNSKYWNRVFNGKPNANAAIALVDENFNDAIHTLPHNTSIIWGAEDPVAPLRTGIMLAGRLANADLAIIEVAGHVPMNSHTDQFNQLLGDAISSNNTKPVISTPLEGTPEDLDCENITGKTYSGHYRHITLEDCTGVVLKNITANSLSIEDSVIEMQNVTVNSDSTALETTESVIVATNLTLAGTIGIMTDGSRLDLAGVSIQGKQAAIKIDNSSRILFSVSDMTSPLFTGNVHGDFREKDRTLDEVLFAKNNPTQDK